MPPEQREHAHLVVAGGGAAGLEAAIALRSLVGARHAITLVAPEDEYVYQPLSVREPFDQGPTPHLPLRDFARDFDVVHCRNRLAAVGTDRSVTLGDGTTLPYDKLIVAIGAPRVAIAQEVLTFRGRRDVPAVRAVLAAIDAGSVRRIAFVVPRGVAWSLPLYELALFTATRARDAHLELTLLTPEDRPLGVFGAKASADVEQRLRAAGIRVEPRANSEIVNSNTVRIEPGGTLVECDQIIALPVTVGPRLWGLPSDSDGFLPIDSFARVSGARDVYAAGDATNFPLKQGGIACQQADAAAEHIAWTLGAVDEPEPFRPVLRGELLTGAAPQFMRHDVTARGDSADVSGERPLWWPATKIAGRYLAAYLAHVDDSAHARIAPGVRRRAFIAPAADHDFEIQLRGYEYEARWGARRAL